MAVACRDAGMQGAERCRDNENRGQWRWHCDHTHGLHTDGVDQNMLNVALLAYMAGKKVRIASLQGMCEADFIAAAQETYF